MDPKAALDAANMYYSDDPLLALEHLLAYYAWRVKGGSQPAGGDLLAEGLAARIQDNLEGLTLQL